MIENNFSAVLLVLVLLASFVQQGSTGRSGIWVDTTDWTLSTSQFVVVISISLAPLYVYILWKCVGVVSGVCRRSSDNTETSTSGNSDVRRWLDHLCKGAKALVAAWRVPDVKNGSTILRNNDEPDDDAGRHCLTNQRDDDCHHCFLKQEENLV